nr:hypothetical protein [Tanacetum cinerariifolium]GEY53367.1 hypothetical protein [Tanacetum cinerariifolium]
PLLDADMTINRGTWSRKTAQTNIRFVELADAAKAEYQMVGQTISFMLLRQVKVCRMDGLVEVSIAFDVARGVEYLHSKKRLVAAAGAFGTVMEDADAKRELETCCYN